MNPTHPWPLCPSSLVAFSQRSLCSQTLASLSFKSVFAAAWRNLLLWEKYFPQLLSILQRDRHVELGQPKGQGRVSERWIAGFKATAAGRVSGV